VVEVVLLGDFNRHDQLWEEDDVTLVRQGEADPIIEMMSELSLKSLLPREKKIWQQGNSAITIDLVLATDELANTVVQCAPTGTEHGSDHRSIETIFDTIMPPIQEKERLLLVT
jgi:endonuclease/exonuclease/phosphatase family metal-dependent hydrolase